MAVLCNHFKTAKRDCAKEIVPAVIGQAKDIITHNAETSNAQS